MVEAMNIRRRKCKGFLSPAGLWELYVTISCLATKFSKRLLFLLAKGIKI